ncbi:MAG: TetR/AcrR family transcriptional regulator [Brachymonas sp.]|nr:TetR/AcrR family transcriptional regulator [Brachymonas sp.]
MRTLDPEKQEAKRRHIMDAAIRCFGKNGFHGTSTNAICAEAGMSPGNLFHYFASKQALIAAIIESEHAAYAARFAELRTEPDAFVALEKIARAVLDQCSNPLYARLWLEIAAEAAANDEIGQVMAASTIAYQKDLAALVRRGQAAGQIAADLKPKDVAMWLLAMSDGFAVQMLGRSSDSLAKHAEVLVPLVRRLLMPQATGGRGAARAPGETGRRKTSRQTERQIGRQTSREASDQDSTSLRKTAARSEGARAATPRAAAARRASEGAASPSVAARPRGSRAAGSVSKVRTTAQTTGPRPEASAPQATQRTRHASTVRRST